MKSPNLRFCTFNNEWKKQKYAEVLKIKHGRSQQGIENSKGKYPILATGGMIGRTDSFLCNWESVLIGRKGTIDRPQYMNEPFWTVDTLFYTEIKENNNAKFIYYIFQNTNWKKYNEASGVPSLSASTIESIQSYFPELEEQQKIADFFTLLDCRIEKQQEKVDALREYKKGMLQKIFSRELRFKDENGEKFPEWELVKMGSITKKVGDRNKTDEKLPVCSVSNKKGFILQSEQFESSRLESLDKTAYKIVYPNQFAYNPARINVGSIGHQKWNMPVLVSSLYVCFELLRGHDAGYVEQFLGTFEFNKEVAINTEGSVREYLFYENFSNIRFPKPVLEEQQKIAKFLSKLDEKIGKEEERLEVLQKQKKGFMQQMFV